MDDTPVKDGKRLKDEHDQRRNDSSDSSPPPRREKNGLGVNPEPEGVSENGAILAIEEAEPGQLEPDSEGGSVPLAAAAAPILTDEESARLFLECLEEIKNRLTPQTFANWLFVLGNCLRWAHDKAFDDYPKLHSLVFGLVRRIVTSEAFNLFVGRGFEANRFYLLGLVEWVKGQADNQKGGIDKYIHVYANTIAKVSKAKIPKDKHDQWLVKATTSLVGNGAQTSRVYTEVDFDNRSSQNVVSRRDEVRSSGGGEHGVKRGTEERAGAKPESLPPAQQPLPKTGTALDAAEVNLGVKEPGQSSPARERLGKEEKKRKKGDKLGAAQAAGGSGPVVTPEQRKEQLKTEIEVAQRAEQVCVKEGRFKAALEFKNEVEEKQEKLEALLEKDRRAAEEEERRKADMRERAKEAKRAEVQAVFEPPLPKDTPEEREAYILGAVKKDKNGEMEVLRRDSGERPQDKRPKSPSLSSNQPQNLLSPLRTSSLPAQDSELKPATVAETAPTARDPSQAPPAAQTGPGMAGAPTGPAAQENVQLSTAEQARVILSRNIPERRVVYVDSRHNVISFFSANLFYTGHTAFPLDVYMSGLVDEGGPQDGDVFVFLGNPPRNFFATWRETTDDSPSPETGPWRPLGVSGGPIGRQ
ncbi:hypothetical protein KFL_003830020 [Klebsormidium nitens]|uniref:Uncharacterized protein n=1 Tax=Klebsormidium nitens TaxID=105231 RepID=A0A1Y1IBB7_KLENI|nr:hypothetical protein KFL_003830020 [Klebsormidium nitens]|eukprot:GAQ87853.1 hypothetical protein KFL_003830020 [Klebsormidium nitens]